LVPKKLASKGPWGAPGLMLVQGLWRACWDIQGEASSFSQEGGSLGSPALGLGGLVQQGSHCLPKGFLAPPLSDRSATLLMVS